MGEIAQEIRAHFVALTHNLLVLFREWLRREHAMKEEKVERKHAKQIREREDKAAAVGRRVAPVQKLLPVAVQLTTQFVRAVRNGNMGRTRWRAILANLRLAMKIYL